MSGSVERLEHPPLAIVFPSIFWLQKLKSSNNKKDLFNCCYNKSMEISFFCWLTKQWGERAAQQVVLPGAKLCYPRGLNRSHWWALSSVMMLKFRLVWRSAEHRVWFNTYWVLGLGALMVCPYSGWEKSISTAGQTSLICLFLCNWLSTRRSIKLIRTPCLPWRQARHCCSIYVTNLLSLLIWYILARPVATGQGLIILN